MKVQVKLFASLRSRMPDSAGRGSVELAENATLIDLLEKLEIPEELSHLTLVNGQHCPRERTWRGKKALSEGDVVSVFPPLAGG